MSESHEELVPQAQCDEPPADEIKEMATIAAVIRKVFRETQPGQQVAIAIVRGPGADRIPVLVGDRELLKMLEFNSVGQVEEFFRDLQDPGRIRRREEHNKRVDELDIDQ